LTEPQNKEALIWFSEELRKAERNKAHQRLVIEVVDGKCRHAESSNKILFGRE